MNNMIQTEHLLLRPWRTQDLDPFAAINADPAVMEFFPSTLTREESDHLARTIITRFEQQGWGFWAVTVLGGAEFIGFVGLNPVSFEAPFTPAVEVGWRLAHEHWGKGYAPEGAQAALRYAFTQLKLDEVVSFTPVSNHRSRRVMEKIGMHHNPLENFERPTLPEGHPLRLHVLYRIGREEWKISEKEE